MDEASDEEVSGSEGEGFGPIEANPFCGPLLPDQPRMMFAGRVARSRSRSVKRTKKVSLQVQQDDAGSSNSDGEEDDDHVIVKACFAMEMPKLHANLRSLPPKKLRALTQKVMKEKNAPRIVSALASSLKEVEDLRAWEEQEILRIRARSAAAMRHAEKQVRTGLHVLRMSDEDDNIDVKKVKNWLHGISTVKSLDAEADTQDNLMKVVADAELAELKADADRKKTKEVVAATPETGSKLNRFFNWL